MPSDTSDPYITVRLPLSSWRGIVNGIENWAGKSMGDIEILADFEFVEIPDDYEVVREDGQHYLLKGKPRD